MITSLKIKIDLKNISIKKVMTESDIKTWYEERKLAFWRGDLTQSEKEKFESIPDWTWYPNSETMTLLCNLRKRLTVGRGRPSKTPALTDEEKKDLQKTRARAYYQKKKAALMALEASIVK